MHLSHPAFRLSLMTSCAIFAWVSGGAAYAQQSGVSPSAQNISSVPESANSDEATDIVVTAQKREQSINDVGLTVTALGSDALKNRQISSLSDIAASVPSLSFTNSANGTPVYTLRGVGFYDTSLGGYPTVSIYVDEVPLPFPVLTTHSAFDLQRIEVLKGPQGTLFGQNATGGAINYIAAKPTRRFEAGVDVSYGRFNEINAEAYVSGPLTETLRARVAARLERADDWQKSASRPGDGLGKARNYMGRLLLDFEPTDTVRLSLNLNGWKDKSDPQAPQFIGIQVQNPGFASPLVLNAPFSSEKPRAADWTQGLPFRDNRFYQAALRADIDVAENVTLTSLTSYVDFKQRQGDEGDGLPAVTLDLPENNGRIKSFSQELRLANSGTSDIRWVVGGNLERSTVNQAIHLRYPDSSANIVLATIGYPIVGGTYTSDQKMRNYAGFANVEYDPSSHFTVKAGVRYTEAKRSAEICNFSDGPPYIIGNFVYDLLAGGLSGPYTPGACFAINDLGRATSGIAPGQPGRFTGKLNEHNTSWRVGVDYKPTRDLLFYLNVSRGYKAGSFPTVSASTFVQYLPVTQESVTAYEGGFKASLLDRMLQLNGAAYYYDYKDKQLRSKTIDLIYGILDVLQNIPKSRVQGVELELTATPARGLTLNAAGTYTDAKIKSFSGVNAGGLQANFSGASIPYTPKWQFTVNGDYRHDLGGDMSAFIGASVSYRSKTVAVIGGETNPTGAISPYPAIYKIDAYSLVDLRAGIAGPDDRWQIQLYGKNVFNKYYWNNVVAAYDTVGRYAGRPATYGIDFRYKFK